MPAAVDHVPAKPVHRALRVTGIEAYAARLEAEVVR